MEKINIAKLLKDCPTGMELDCTICDNVCLDEVTPNMIKCFVKNDVYNTIYFHHDGTYLLSQNAKCVIFPKGKTTWEGFQRPFKDGDIVVAEDEASFQMFLLKEVKRNEDDDYDGDCYFGWDFDDNQLFHEGIWGFNRLATEEEKERLFEVIKDNGYCWNPETKTLEKLIKPKFKVGDTITNGAVTSIIKQITKDSYILDIKDYDICFNYVFFKDQDKWKLIPNKFDISTLVPFESRVLVRQSDIDYWKPAFWGKRITNKNFPFITSFGSTTQAIPFKGNEWLIGTTDDCNTYYKTWE